MAKVKAAKAKPKTGRPSIYSSDLAAKICARIAEGQSLRQICEAAGMPTKRTVLRWLADDRRPDFCHQYARAREAQMEALVEEILEIADGTPAEKGAVALARLRIDTRKWMMSKLAPKKYGDKLDLEINDKRPRTREERQARIAELLEMRNGNGGSDVAPVPEPKLH